MGIGGYAMKDNVRGGMANHFAGDGGIGRQRQRRQPARPPGAGQDAAVNTYVADAILDPPRPQLRLC